MKKWFKGINTLDELKAAYRKLAMANHPDHGGSLEAMQEINAEYDILSKTLAYSKQGTAEQQQADYSAAEAFKDVIMSIIHLIGIEIEICGSWVWVSGNTKEHKETLKANGFMWASKKQMWYWRAAENKSHGKKNTTMADIRTKYGSEKINPTFRPTLS